MRDLKQRLKLLANWKRALILSLIASFTLGVSSCPNNGAPDLKWSPKIYAGDARSQSIVRKNGNSYEQIKTSSSKFDSMICTHNSEIEKFKKAYFEVINSCEKWKKGAKTASEATYEHYFQNEIEFQNLEELIQQ